MLLLLLFFASRFWLSSIVDAHSINNLCFLKNLPIFSFYTQLLFIKTFCSNPDVLECSSPNSHPAAHRTIIQVYEKSISISISLNLSYSVLYELSCRDPILPYAICRVFQTKWWLQHCNQRSTCFFYLCQNVHLHSSLILWLRYVRKTTDRYFEPQSRAHFQQSIFLLF